MKKQQLKELLKHIIQEVKRNSLTESNDKDKLFQLKQKRKVLSKRFKNSSGEGDSRNTHLAQRELEYQISQLEKTLGISENSVNVTQDPKLKQGTEIPMGAVNVEEEKSVNEVLTPAVIDRARIFAGAALRWAVDPTSASSALKRLAFKVAKPDLRKDYELAAQYVLDPKMAKTLQEMSSTGGVAGYATPYAFSKKGSGAKRALDVTKKMGMKVVGEAPRV